VVPPAVRLTQSIKHRDEHGKLLSVEIRAAASAKSFPNLVRFTSSASTVPCVIGSMLSHGIPHAFAKRDATWDALIGLQLFDHNFHRAHQALRLPSEEEGRRYRQQSPAMVLGITDHLWSFQELLTSRVSTTP
jgi:hypothetical protein